MNRKLVCPKHHELYSNYCLICMEPLCPSCIEGHYQVHKDTGQFKVETLKNVQANCISKIVKLRDIISQENKKLDADHSQFNVASLFEKIMAAKKSMMAEINKIVESRSRDIQIMENQYRRTQIKKPCIEAAEVINDFLGRLDINHPMVVETLRHVIEFNDNEFVKVFYKQLNDNYSKIRNTKCEIIFEEIRYRNVLQECFKIINPYHVPPKPFEQAPMNVTISQDDTANIFKRFLLEPTNTMMKPEPPGDQTVRKPNAPPDTRPLIIKNYDEMSDTMVQSLNPANEFQMPLLVPEISKTLMHYFQPDSANFHMVMLQGFKHRVTELSFPFPIPLYHKSLQLPTGSIILTGGKLFNGKKSTKVFIYSIERNKLKEYCSVIPRSSHALCYHDEHVYIMGGFGESSIQRTVEKMSLGEKPKVSIVRPPKFGGFCTATVFNDFIFKLSTEGVEVYQPSEDQWTYIVLKNYMYFENCGAIQSNENEVFVFGGYDEAQRGVRNTYSIFVGTQGKTLNSFTSSTMKICRENKFPLPKGQGFEDNTVEIYQGKIFALQNVCDDFNECIDNERTLLCFNGKGWEIIQQSE